MATKFSESDKDVKRKIIKAANTIRKKYLALKLERSEEDEALNKFLKPVVKPLTKLAENASIPSQKRKRVKIKEEVEETLQPKKPKEEEPPPKQEIIPKFLQTEPIAESKSDTDDEVFEEPSIPELKHKIEKLEQLEQLESSRRNNSEIYNSFLEQYPEIAREYLDEYFASSEKINPDNYLDYDPSTEKWKIGSLPLDFLKNGNIKVDKTIYPGTEGLYELLFMKKPYKVTSDDRKQFAKMLEQIDVKKRTPSTSFRASIPKSQSPSTSFRASIPKPQSRPRMKTRSQAKSGGSLLEYNEKSKEFVYYNDVNELVERFKKLEASSEVGNNNNSNEIFSILGELERLGVIEFYK